MLQRLSIALAQVEITNTSENLLHGICQIIYTLSQVKETTRNLHNNLMNSIKVWYKINTIFLNSENSYKISDLNRLLQNVSDKTHLKRRDKYGHLSNLTICYT